MRVAPHHHPCRDCAVKVECGGTWAQNWDGWPEVYCPEFEQHRDDYRCDECHEKYEAAYAAELAAQDE